MTKRCNDHQESAHWPVDRSTASGADRAALILAPAIGAVVSAIAISTGTAAPITPNLIARPNSFATSSGSIARPALTMIQNRARTLGNLVSPSGTRYFAVGDQDLQGVHSIDAMLARLAPQQRIHPGDGVRRVDVVVDLRRPLQMNVPAGTDVRIGTPIVDPRASVEVRGSIFANDVSVVETHTAQTGAK